MKKYPIAIIVLFLIQAGLYIGLLALVINLRSDCMSIHASDGSLWQCSGPADPTRIPMIAALVLPPILGKLILRLLRLKLSWKQIFISYAAAFLILLAVYAFAGQPHCGCGG